MKKIAILLICVLALFAVNGAFAALQPQMDVHVDNIKVGETAHVQIRLPIDAKGIVTVSVDGHDFNATIFNGNATVDLTGLNAGNHTVKVKYPGEGNYSNVTKEARFEVINPALVNNSTGGNASGLHLNNTTINNNTNVTPNNHTNITPNNHTNITPANNTNITPNNHTNITPGNNTNITPDNHTNVTPANNTNITPNNHTNVTPIIINNITNNTNKTNTTNITNNTTDNTVVQMINNHPPRKPPKPHNPGFDYRDTGLPIAVAIIVIIAIVGGVIYKRR